MRSIWKGAISFGLVTIPVRLYTATEEKDVSFHQVRRSDGSRIRYKRVAEADGEEVPYADIAKGYELPNGETVVLTDEDFADLPLTTSRTVEVLQFVPLEQVDPIYFAKSYYLEPEKTGDQAVRAAARRAGEGRTGSRWSRWPCGSASRWPRCGCATACSCWRPCSGRTRSATPDFGFLDEDVEVRPQELAMAESLIEALAGDFDPDAVHRRVPRGAREAHRGQGRGPRGGRAGRRGGGDGHRRRPDGRPAGQRRGGQEGAG